MSLHFLACLVLAFLHCCAVAAQCGGKFGPYIEGAAVTKDGQAVAVNWGRSDQRNTIGYATGSCGLLATVGDMSGSILNGVRVLPDGSMLATDMGNHRVVFIPAKPSDGKPKTYCKADFIQPNDLAVSSKGMVYLSGQRWTENTVEGDGDIWLCKKGAATRLAGNLGRTNGIELSPDEKTLYVSEAFNKGGPPVSNKIWKYPVRGDGTLGPRELFFDFAADDSPSVDVDGMRVDTDGNLYVARNEGAAVAVLSPAGKVVKKLPLSFSAPTNLEFAGPDGKTLVVVGRCGKGTPYGSGSGCVSTFQVEKPGRYWSWLQRGTPTLPQ